MRRRYETIRSYHSRRCEDCERNPRAGAVEDGVGNRLASGVVKNTSFEDRAARQHEVKGVVAVGFNAQELNDAMGVIGVVWASQIDSVYPRWNIRSRPVSVLANKKERLRLDLRRNEKLSSRLDNSAVHIHRQFPIRRAGMNGNRRRAVGGRGGDDWCWSAESRSAKRDQAQENARRFHIISQPRFSAMTQG